MCVLYSSKEGITLGGHNATNHTIVMAVIHDPVIRLAIKQRTELWLVFFSPLGEFTLG
jgi:hypothetical protein